MDTRLNKSDYTLLALIYFVTILINSYEYYKVGNEPIEYVADFSAVVITSFACIWVFMYLLIPKFLVNQKKYLLFALFGLLTLCVAGILEYTVGFWSAGDDWSKYLKPPRLLLEGVFRGSDNTGIAFGILLAKKFYESQTKIVDIQKKQKENELKLLRSQIDPHFLFNNLNTLDALIDSDSDKAKEYINRLSLIYRYLIKTKDVEVMELSEELGFAENYLFLINTRFGDDYQFTINKKGSISNKFIPTGALQTLLENVVKHNKPLHNNSVRASIDIDDQWISVTNSKTNQAPRQESLGTGLENLKARYKLLSDQLPKIANSQKEFRVVIPIIQLSTEN